MSAVPGAGRPARVSLQPDSAPEGPDPVVIAPDAAGWSVDGAPWGASLVVHDGRHATLLRTGPDGARAARHDILLLPGSRPGDAGSSTVEVVVDGWRYEVVVQDEALASLRDRARRGRSAEGSSRPVEVRAMIPGRIASVAVVAGQVVESGSTLLVIEAMKMQNELRAPRAGVVTRLAVEAGRTVEAGELLAVIE